MRAHERVEQLADEIDALGQQAKSAGMLDLKPIVIKLGQKQAEFNQAVVEALRQ